MVALALVLALVLGGAIAVVTGRVAVAEPVEVDTSTSISETASEGFKFDVCSFEMLPTGVVIDLTFFNADLTNAHTFTILKYPNYLIPTSDTTDDLYDLTSRYGTLVNTTAQPGGYGNNSTTPTVISFMAPATASWYEFVCLEPGHFTDGMYGFIAFGENLPASLSCGGGSPGAGLAVFIIVGTIVTLTVLAIVLGFVIGKREGAQHEMPPERLGYPEPTGPESLPTEEPPAAPPRPPGTP